MSSNGTMRHLLKPLILVLAIPALASAAGVFGRGAFEARWNQLLVRRLAMERLRPTPRFMALNSLPALCSDARSSGRVEECGTYHLFGATVSGATTVAGVGLVVFAGLLAAGRLLRLGRPRAAALFRPALWGAACAIGLLAAAHGVLFVVAYYLLAVGGSAPQWLIAAVAMGAVAVVVGIVASAFSLVRRPALAVVGRELDLAAQPALASFLRDLAERTRAPMPDHVVAGVTPGLFMTDARVTHLDGASAGRTLYLSLPWCRVLTVAEFRALTAREFAPFAPGEAPQTRLLGFHTLASYGLASLRARARGIRAAAVSPPVALLSLLIESPETLDRAARERAEASDRAAADVAGSAVLASALAKARGFETVWRRVSAEMADAVAGATRYVSTSALFARAVAEAGEAASVLVDGVERIDEDLTEVQHLLIARHVQA
jgi:hypothetical protein